MKYELRRLCDPVQYATAIAPYGFCSSARWSGHRSRPWAASDRRPAGFLTLRDAVRICRQTCVLGTKRFTRPGGLLLPLPFALLTRSFRLPGRYQMTFAVTDQISTPHAFQRFTQYRPVVGVMVTQECLVQPSIFKPFGMNTSSLL